MSDVKLPEPVTRQEQYLKYIADNYSGSAVNNTETITLPEPITRQEQYLKYIADNCSGGGGDLSNYYTKTETDTLLTAKANSVDVYTKTQADNTFVAKTDLHISDAPTSAEINEAISNIWGD